MRILNGLAAIVLGLGLAACGDGANLPDSARENGLTSDEQQAEDNAEDDGEEAEDRDESGEDEQGGDGEHADAECYDLDEGLRECVVEDGDTLCVFIYEAESGEMLEGECEPVASEEEEDDCPCDDDDDSMNDPSDGEDRPCPDEDGQHPDEDWGDDSWDDEGNGGMDPSQGQHECVENEDGSGACTFDDGQGNVCTVAWDANGEVSEDSCSTHPEQP